MKLSNNRNNEQDDAVRTRSLRIEAAATRKKNRVVIAAVAVIVTVLAAVCLATVSSRISATTMRILALKGEVLLKEWGLPRTPRENIRLKDGNRLTTGESSFVKIELDDTKLVTLEEFSSAVFSQKDRKIDLELERGDLSFDVSRPLLKEESFDIRTSTMIVGIRGTTGTVFCDDGRSGVFIEEGQVHVIGRNPVSGEEKETDVHSGERLTVTVDRTKEEDSITFDLEETGQQTEEADRPAPSVEEGDGSVDLHSLKLRERKNVQLHLGSSYVSGGESWESSFGFEAKDGYSDKRSSSITYDLDRDYGSMSFRLTPYHGTNGDRFTGDDASEVTISNADTGDILYDSMIDGSVEVVEDFVDLTGVGSICIEVRLSGGDDACILMKDVRLYK